MSFEPALSVIELSKCYELYSRPFDRLLQLLAGKETKLYREHWALRGVTFEVAKGEKLGIIGRNGSGKSTLLQLVCGTLRPTRGSVHARGRITALLELGSGFSQESTGRENIYLNGAVLGMSREEIERRIESILEFADIGYYIDQPVKSYSSGMFVRLAFSVQAFLEPEILIVDEALAVGDVFFQQKCMKLMRERMASVTSIVVSHDLGSISRLCNRVIVLARGEKIFDGPPLEAIEVYTKHSRREDFQVGPEKFAGRAGEFADHADIVPVTPTSLSGKLEAAITGFRVRTAGATSEGTVEPHQRVDIDIYIDATGDLGTCIVGYFVNDRHGVAIFGENSASAQRGLQIRAGRTIVHLSFLWPELAAGSYFLTLGVGRGEHALHHEIQCWAHNVFVFRASTGAKPVHGMFNVPIIELDVVEPR